MPAYLYPDSTSDQFLTKTGIQTITGAKTFLSASASVVGLTVQAAPSQTASLVEFRLNDGTLRSGITPAGFGFFGGPHLGAHLSVSTPNPGERPLLVRGAAGQTNNLAEFQVSGGAVAMAVNPVGYLTFPGAGAGQTGSLIQARRSGNSIEFGHGNQAGYASVIGAENGSGAPTVVFSGEHGTTSNTYTSRGFRTMVLRYAPSATPYLAFGSVADPNLANQTLNEVWRVDTRGYMDVGAKGHIGRVSIYAGHPAEKALVVRGEASQTGNMQEWQLADGTIKSSVGSFGDGHFQTAAAGPGIGQYAYSASLSVGTGGSTGLKGAVIRGSAGQTANLQEWQDSAGNVLAHVNPGGTIFWGINNLRTDRVVNGDFNTQRPSGIYDMNNCTNAPTGDGWHHLIQMTHGNNNSYMYQIAFQLGSQSSTMWTRQCTAGTWHAWRAI